MFQRLTTHSQQMHSTSSGSQSLLGPTTPVVILVLLSRGGESFTSILQNIMLSRL